LKLVFPSPVAVSSVAPSSKPVTLPASHTVLVNGSGIRQSMGHHSYQPSSYYSQNKMTSSYTSSNPYATLVYTTLSIFTFLVLSCAVNVQGLTQIFSLTLFHI
jgi:hypothetical protein